MLAMLIGGVQRNKPAGFGTLPISLVTAYGVGSVIPSYTSAVTAGIAYRAEIFNATECTLGTGGTDSTAGNNTFFATADYAIKTWTGGSVIRCVSDMTISGLDFRTNNTSQIGAARTVNGAANNGAGLIRLQTTVAHTFSTGDRVIVAGVGGTTEANGNWLITVIDTTHFDLIGSTFVNAFTTNGSATKQAPLMKVLYANGFNVIFRTSAAVDVTTATYTADGVLTNIYGTPASWLTGSAQVTRILRTDQTDSYGYTKQFVKYLSKAALAAATTTDGWYWDNAAKQLWVHLAGDLNVETNKAILKALYLDTSGNSRIVVMGTALGLDGIRMEGMQFVQSDALVGSLMRQSIWTNNITQLWSTDKGYQGTLSGDFVETNSLVYSSVLDGRNAFAPSTLTGKGLIQSYNSRYINNGDPDIFPSEPLFGTLQGISAHGGSDHTSWGSQFIGNGGNAVSDSAIVGNTNYSWLVGCTIGPSDTAAQPTVATIGAGSVAGTRIMYLDTNVTTKVGTYDLEMLGAAVVYTYRTAVPSVNGGTPTAYIPVSPP